MWPFGTKRNVGRQFTVNRVDHGHGGTSVELVPVTYTGVPPHRLRAGDIVELVKPKKR